MNQPGHLIIEFLIYFCVSTLLIMMTMQWITTAHLQGTQISHASADASALWAAHDCVVRDVMQAVPVSAWKMVTPEKIIFTVHDHDVSWELSGTTLTRTQGKFNNVSKHWTDKTTAVIADNVTALRVQPDRDNPGCVQLHLKGRVGTTPYDSVQIIMPRARVLA